MPSEVILVHTAGGTGTTVRKIECTGLQKGTIVSEQGTQTTLHLHHADLAQGAQGKIHNTSREALGAELLLARPKAETENQNA